jgi:hypothetical protein
LACEHVADSLCRIRLKFLVFKLEFHSIFLFSKKENRRYYYLSLARLGM